jgi:trigger factor
MANIANDKYLEIANTLFNSARITENTEGKSKIFSAEVMCKPITEQADEEIKEAQKDFKMAGFRPGKVPLNIVRKKVGPDLLKNTISRVVDNVIKVMLTSKGIVPAMQPEVKIETFEANAKFNESDSENTGSLKFTVKIEELPEMPKIQWKEVNLELIKIEPVDEDLKKAHEDILKNFKNFKKAEGAEAVKEGDSVEINYNATVDGNEFNGSKAEGIRVNIGGSEFIPGFTEHLVGMKKGESKQFAIKLPFNYLDNKVASKEASFTVTVLDIYHPESVSEINEEFVQSMGLKSLDEFNDLLKKKIEADLSVFARLFNKKELFDVLDQNYTMDVPEAMVKADLQATTAQMADVMRNNPEFKGKSEADLQKEYEALSRRRVKLGVILAHLAKEFELRVTDEDIEKVITLEKMQRPGQEKLIDEMYKDEANRNRLIGPHLEEKVFDHIVNNLLEGVKTKVVTSEQFMKEYAPKLTSTPASA